MGHLARAVAMERTSSSLLPKGSSSDRHVSTGLPDVPVAALVLAHSDVLACGAAKAVSVLSLKTSPWPCSDTYASSPPWPKDVPCPAPLPARPALADQRKTLSPCTASAGALVGRCTSNDGGDLSAKQDNRKAQPSAGMLVCHCPAVGSPWCGGLPVGCCRAVTCHPDPPECSGWGPASGTQTLPGEGSPGGVSPAWRADLACPGQHWLLPCMVFPSLLSQPPCFGRESASANGKLTSGSVHTCNQQCWGKEARIYPPPVVLDNASACSLSSS